MIRSILTAAVLAAMTTVAPAFAQTPAAPACQETYVSIPDVDNTKPNAWLTFFGSGIKEADIRACNSGTDVILRSAASNIQGGFRLAVKTNAGSLAMKLPTSFAAGEIGGVFCHDPKGEINPRLLTIKWSDGLPSRLVLMNKTEALGDLAPHKKACEQAG